LLRALLAAEASRAVALVLACLGAYLWLYLPQIPASGAPWGHDYALHLPNLLAGQFWFQTNGPFAVPWFSPAQCAGVPYLGDLNVAYYSLPQWATFALGPVSAVRSTFILCAALGACGFFVLMRGPFAASPWAAATAAVLFLFSGFFTYRMIVGHLTFHPFVLSPWLAWAVLAGDARPAARGGWRWLWPASAGGLMFAYMFHAGMVHAIPPVAIAVAVIVLVHGNVRGHRPGPWLTLSAAALVALALGAQRLSAAIAFLQNFPRDEYPLPGFSNPLDALRVVVQSLFWRPPAAAAQSLLTNLELPLERHEWEYGVGPAAALLLLAGAASFVWRRHRFLGAESSRAQGVLVAGAIAIALAIPVALNWHHPQWHAFLKSQPLFGSSSNLLRWLALYAPLAAFFAGLAFDRVVPAGRMRAGAAVLVAAATIAWNWTAERSYYAAQSYSAAAVERSWRAVSAGAPVPAVTHLSVRVDGANRLLVPIDRNDDMIRGYSQLLCYQPMFGYGLERLRHGSLHPGPALADLGDGTLNLKNPACYQFPGANACAPGDHFRPEQREAAARFLRYQPFAFHRPWWQHVADALTMASLLLSLAALGAGALLAWRERLKAGATPGSR